MNALFGIEELPASRSRQLSIDYMPAEVTVDPAPAEQPVEDQGNEDQGDGLFALALTEQPVDGALFGVTVATPAAVSVVAPVHGDPATCGARGYRKLACRVCWPNTQRCGWGSCTSVAPIAVADAGGDEMPVCRRCARLAVRSGYREIGAGRA